MSGGACYLCQNPSDASCHWCDPAQKGMIGKWVCEEHCVYINPRDFDLDALNLPLSCCKPCQETVVGKKEPETRGYFYRKKKKNLIHLQNTIKTNI